MKKMKEECLICKAPLEYLERDVPVECEICISGRWGKPGASRGIMYAMHAIWKVWTPS